jgi:hypothetical protein
MKKSEFASSEIQKREAGCHSGLPLLFGMAFQNEYYIACIRSYFHGVW